MLEGRLKYGKDNFRGCPVEAMTYVGAGMRHLFAWAEGEQLDPDSGLPHLWKALANIAILIDSQVAGTLIDNRKYPGGYAHIVKQAEVLGGRLRERHADKAPKHYDQRDLAESGHDPAYASVEHNAGMVAAGSREPWIGVAAGYPTAREHTPARSQPMSDGGSPT